MTDTAERAGVRHLTALAARPRPAGSAAERDARAYAARELARLGFTVREEPFSYSAFPGRYATPVGGAMIALTIVSAASAVLSNGASRAAAIVLLAGTGLTGLFARWMFGDAQHTLPWCREESVNLVAARRHEPPRMWLVAHLDSKSQPVPSAARVAGVLVLLAALAGAFAAAGLTLAGMDVRTVWWAALLLAVAGGLPVMASVVGAHSNGAVDNASGVAAVLVAAGQLAPGVACGVLLSSAEELGLAGVRAWTRDRAPAIALNCDGVDDDGDLVIMFNGVAPAPLVDAVRNAATDNVRVRRMPMGLLTDSSALASRGWRTATVSRGSLATLGRIHTTRDSLANLRGTSIDDVGRILARAAEELAR